MFERFTERARRVTLLAEEEARMLNHNYIGTEHILLGLIREDQGLAAKALESLGISSLEGVRQQVEEIIGPGERIPAAHIPLRPRAKKVLELSLSEALRLGHNYIGTEHILLGLIREGDGVGAQILWGEGLDPNRVRRKVTQFMHLLPGGMPPAEGSASRAAGETGQTQDSAEAEIGRLRIEIVRLRALLCEHGIDPDPGYGDSAGTMTPAEREARWALSVRFAIGAASEAEAQAVIGQALAKLDRLPLQREPTIAPMGLRDGIWAATLEPDLTVLSSVEPDDASNRCRYVTSHFGKGVTWTSRITRRGARWDWPPDIWSRSPGQDDVLLHPAVQAVMIWCEAK
jgi:hypothetical protein